MLGLPLLHPDLAMPEHTSLRMTLVFDMGQERGFAVSM
jgi:hypothetical protein